MEGGSQGSTARGRKLPKPVHSTERLRARARVYLALKNYEKSLADAEVVVTRQLGTDGGDALWALMVFAGFGFLLPRASTLTLALLALCVAWGVEFSQLYHAPWIDAVRATIPGKLVLGRTFLWPDLVAYAAGIALGALAEWRLRK